MNYLNWRNNFIVINEGTKKSPTGVRNNAYNKESLNVYCWCTSMRWSLTLDSNEKKINHYISEKKTHKSKP